MLVGLRDFSFVLHAIRRGTANHLAPEKNDYRRIDDCRWGRSNPVQSPAILTDTLENGKCTSWAHSAQFLGKSPALTTDMGSVPNTSHSLLFGHFVKKNEKRRGEIGKNMPTPSAEM